MIGNRFLIFAVFIKFKNRPSCHYEEAALLHY